MDQTRSRAAEATVGATAGPEVGMPQAVALRGVIGSTEGKLFWLSPGPNVVGRAQDSDIRVIDTGVSRSHAELSLRADGKVVLFDLGSTNGTFVLGTRVDHQHEHEVGPGALIGFGPDAVMQLVRGLEVGPSPPRP